MDLIEVKQLWEKATDALRENISPINCALWVDVLTPVTLDGENFCLSCPTQTNLDYFLENYKDAAERAISEAFGRSLRIQVSLSVGSDPFPSELIDTQNLQRELEQGLARESLLTLDDFHAGAENQFPYQAAKQVVENPGRWNPLFLYGDHGVGKTHLAKAILNENLLKGRAVKYIQGHQFYNLYYSTTQNRQYDRFYALFRDVDLLVVDDIQFFEGKTKTQETFFHIFNSLYEAGAQIVISADRPPSKIVGLEQALLSRLNWGLLMELSNPGPETRRAIIGARAASIKGLKGDVLDHFVSKPFPTVRDLEGLTTRLQALSELSGLEVTKEVIDKEFSRLEVLKPVHLQVEDVQEAVCEYFHVSHRDLVGSKRVKKISRPRQVAMYLAKKHTTKTLPQIGDLFGRKAHSTVHNACSRIDEIAAQDPQLLRDIQEIEKLLDS